MCYFDVILLSDVISSIGPKISDADTYVNSCVINTIHILRDNTFLLHHNYVLSHAERSHFISYLDHCLNMMMFFYYL